MARVARSLLLLEKLLVAFQPVELALVGLVSSVRVLVHEQRPGHASLEIAPPVVMCLESVVVDAQDVGGWRMLLGRVVVHEGVCLVHGEEARNKLVVVVVHSRDPRWLCHNLEERVRVGRTHQEVLDDQSCRHLLVSRTPVQDPVDDHPSKLPEGCQHVG
eukprot:CAMPEP_0180199486 /NCGR_PEP_ID=MMETSP0987-20121128/5740_1 /TAXON_ID=697907 /ORGANISM="non described non described, Strain CCMP2293" /LENGTH=159 /DNA_ID=CAMNT_0022154585 /DNA_START=57 /DNA_END=536 /DNA_ORIENTATION=-